MYTFIQSLILGYLQYIPTIKGDRFIVPDRQAAPKGG